MNILVHDDLHAVYQQDMIQKIAGKEILYKIFRKEKTDRPAWVPYTGIHAGSLKNYDSIEILKNEKKLFEALVLAHKLYVPDGLPVIFDLQMEAEILGCELAWKSRHVPVVKSHPFEFNKKGFPDLPQANQGRIPMVMNTLHKLQKHIGDQTAIYGLVTGPLTLAFQLRGMLLFMDFYDDTDYLKRLLDFCTDVCIRVSQFYIDEKTDVIGIVDPLISQISNDLYSAYLTQWFKKIFGFLNDQKVFSSFVVYGDVTENIESMAMSGPDCIAVDETANINTLKTVADSYNIILSGNIPADTLVAGNVADNQKYVIKLLENIGHNNFIVAPGCDLPYDVPKENLIGISRVVHKIGTMKHKLVI